MRVTPLHDRVLVRRFEEGEQKTGGIVIPDTAKEKPQQGQVIAVGKGRVNDEGKRVPLELEKGDRILFAKYAQEITVAGETFLILRQEEVLAVLGGHVIAASRQKPQTAGRTKTNGKGSKRKKLTTKKKKKF